MTYRAVHHSAVSVIFAGMCLVLLNGCTKKEEKPRERPPALVMTAPVTRKDVPVQLKAIGTVEASESVAVRTQISGELVKVGFREGQDVQRGALLFQLDPRVYQAAVRKAEATLARDQVLLENARKDYGRYAQLVKDGIVTHEQAEGFRTRAESAEADVAADRAALVSAREQLAYCTIVSPISGRLGALAVDRGNVVKANETVLVTINKLTPVNIVFTVPEKELPELKRHLSAGRVEVVAVVPGITEIKERGTVSFLDNAVDPGTGTIKLKAEFANGKRQLWPGQFVHLAITLSVKKDAVVVPGQAVQTGQKGQHVFVARTDGTAELRPVTVGPADNGVTVIEAGLRPGEQVVIDGQMRVVPGGKIEIKQPDKAGGGMPAPTAVR